MKSLIQEDLITKQNDEKRLAELDRLINIFFMENNFVMNRIC